MKRRLAVALIALGVGFVGLGALAPAAHANDDQRDKVWVCKYVGKPGVDERLKGGKNPIHVNDAATDESEVIGASFADAQGRSVIVAGEDSECPAPTPPSSTTTTTFKEETSTTSTSFLTTTTSTTVPSVTTTLPGKHSTSTSSPVSSVPKRGSTTPPQPGITPSRTGATLPFTGSDTGAWLALGAILLGAGVCLVVSAKQNRKGLF